MGPTRRCHTAAAIAYYGMNDLKGPGEEEEESNDSGLTIWGRPREAFPSSSKVAIGMMLLAHIERERKWALEKTTELNEIVSAIMNNIIIYPHHNTHTSYIMHTGGGAQQRR